MVGESVMASFSTVEVGKKVYFSMDQQKLSLPGNYKAVTSLLAVLGWGLP